jgi:hypothetical protein
MGKLANGMHLDSMAAPPRLMAQTEPHMRLRRRIFITRHPHRLGDILWFIAGILSAIAIGVMAALEF